MLTTQSGRKASQDEYELRCLIALMENHGVRNYLEIGARHGDTFYEVMKSLPKGSRGLAVDWPGALWGTSKSLGHLKARMIELRHMGYVVDMLIGDSQTEQMRLAVEAYGPFDAALIDGDHTYEGVKRDWELYGSIAPIIAFHDIVGEGQAEKVHGRGVEVPRLWSEVRQPNSLEFVAPGSRMGIGVLCK